jgi:hypothetical protein
MKIKIEKPRLGIPISLIIDDAVPCINALYYFNTQVRHEKEHHHQYIPLSFMEQFVEVCSRQGIRGKFTVLPYPAGLGSLVERWEVGDWEEKQRWLEIARTAIEPQFDITPEILTHTLALDLLTHQLIPEAEHLWMANRTQAELTEYMGTAVRLLRQAGFSPTGITQPVSFNGDREAYSHAVLDALRPDEADPAGYVAFYFTDSTPADLPVTPHPVLLMDRERGEAVVSIIDYTDDFFWNTQWPGEMPVGEPEEALIRMDGQAGRLVDLIQSGAWVVFTTHWQSLYANGTCQGLNGLDEVAARLRRTFGSRLVWMKNSQVARYRASEESCQITSHPDQNEARIRLDSAFDCPDFTFTINPQEGSADKIERIQLVSPEKETHLLTGDLNMDGLLMPGSWRQTQDGLSICLDLKRGVQELEFGRAAK